MTWLLIILGLFVWVAVFFGLLDWGTDGGALRMIVSIVLFLSWAALPVIWLASVASNSSDAYRDRCRAAGGVPVDAYRATNCQGPDGRFLDIE